jgi:hypothetical protein
VGCEVKCGARCEVRGARCKVRGSRFEAGYRYRGSPLNARDPSMPATPQCPVTKCNTKTSTPHISINIGLIKAALTAIKLLKLNKKLVYTKIIA